MIQSAPDAACCPFGVRVNAIERPSGDHAGFVSTDVGSRESSTGGEPNSPRQIREPSRLPAE